MTLCAEPFDGLYLCTLDRGHDGEHDWPEGRERSTGASYGHAPQMWTQIRDCGCQDCDAWFLAHPECVA